VTFLAALGLVLGLKSSLKIRDFVLELREGISIRALLSGWLRTGFLSPLGLDCTVFLVLVTVVRVVGAR